MGRIVDCNGCGSAFSRVYKSGQVGPTVAQGKAWKLSEVRKEHLRVDVVLAFDVDSLRLHPRQCVHNAESFSL